jgi:hypothetical protein
MSAPFLATASGQPITTASGLKILLGGANAVSPKIRLVYPTGMTAAKWCSQMSQALSDAVPQLPTVTRDSEWAGWARSVCRAQSMAQYTPPVPDRYHDWKRWAGDFVKSLNSGVGV